MNAPKRKIQSARWEQIPQTNSVWFKFGRHAKGIDGPVATELLELGVSGAIDFAKPRKGQMALVGLGIGYVHNVGLLVLYRKHRYGRIAASCLGVICPQWRKALGVERSGQWRWAAVG